MLYQVINEYELTIHYHTQWIYSVNMTNIETCYKKAK